MGVEPANKDRIVLDPYDASYPIRFQAEEKRVRSLLGDTVVSFQHVGSTSIPGIRSKPLIDMSLWVKPFPLSAVLLDSLRADGYVLWELNSTDTHMFFYKGMPRTHHLHVCPESDDYLRAQVLFRDYLIAHPEEARTYEALKLGLADRFADDRASYFKGKEDFVLEAVRKARTEAAVKG